MKLLAAVTLHFTPMTFTSELDLDMVVTYLHAKNQVNRSIGSKVIQKKKLLAAVTLHLAP